MKTFIQHKPFDFGIFAKYLEPAIETNQYTNYGEAVKLLERRARTMLKISANKAIIATSSGASALNAIFGVLASNQPYSLVYSQDFTFPCNFQIPNVNTIPLDMERSYSPYDNQTYYKVDYSNIVEGSIVIVTNCFGHLQDLGKLEKFANKKELTLIYDNAATPYSFYEDSNSCNYGFASYISLHHTKPIGFGEGGLVIIDKAYENTVRSVINFGNNSSEFSNKIGSNYKMSEISAAAILQWWDSFNIDSMADKYKKSYREQLVKYANNIDYCVFEHCGDSNFFPNCLPLIKQDLKVKDIEDQEVRKYYKPMSGLSISKKLYDRIQCVPIAENT